MRALICPTCGCSLVRLGISKEKATPYSYNNDEYYFCCQGCVDLFILDPQKYLNETNNMIVCPTCLAEKSPQNAVKLKIANKEVSFCRCPHCADLFKKNPDFYIKRLSENIPTEGLLDYEGCCIRPN